MTKKMKLFSRNHIIALALAAATAVPASAQLTAASAFADAPASLFPLLDRNTRLDMIDYFKGGSETASSNALKGNSKVTSLTDNEISISMTDASTYEIALLPGKTEPVIAVIQTVATPARDSRISFFSSSWAPLDAASIFTAPVLADWLTPEARKNGASLDMVPFMLADYSYSPDTSELTLKNNLVELLSADVYSLIEADLLPALVYKWDGSRMVRTK